MASDRLRREIESLLRWPMRGGISTHLRGPVLGMRSSAVGESGYPPMEEPDDSATGFIFAPTSLSALYSWGVPYESGGVPINPPLGTVLTSANYRSGTFKRQYRLIEGAGSTWTCTHNQAKLGGRLWKRTGGRMLSWGPVAGFNRVMPNGWLSAPIYYLGDILCTYPDGGTSETHHILAANYTGNTLFVLLNLIGSSNLYIAKRTVDWDARVGTGSWTVSSAFVLPSSYRSSLVLYDFGLADINNSCNEAVVTTWTTDATYGNKTAEIKIAWDSALTVTTEVLSTSIDTISQPKGAYAGWEVVDASSTPIPFDPSSGENWAGCEFGLGNDPQYLTYFQSQAVDWEGSCTALLSVRYLEDSDDKTRLAVRLRYSHTGEMVVSREWTWVSDGAPSPFWYLTAIVRSDSSWEQKTTTLEVLQDDNVVQEFVVYRYRQDAGDDRSSAWTWSPPPKTGTGSGSVWSVTSGETWKIAVHPGLAEAREGGVVVWRVRTELLDNDGASTLSGYTGIDQCTPIETDSGEDNDTTNQVFEYAWRNGDGVDEIEDYTYTTAFVSVTARNYLWSSNPEHWPQGLYQIMWERGLMLTDVTDQSAALWAPGLALVQNWVQPTAGSTTTKLSLPYWSGGDLLSLASADGDNQAISPRWGTGISGRLAGWGVVG